jgi:uncharacterized membrane protein YqjE
VPNEDRPDRGLVSSLRALGATLADLVGTRAELALVELGEMAERRKRALVLAIVGGVFLAMGLLLAALFVVALFWDTHRLAAIAGVTLLYLVIGLGALLRLRALEEASPPPFEATLRELSLDREMLRPRDE